MSPPQGSFVINRKKEAAFVVRKGVLQLADGSRRLVSDEWKPCKAVVFDRQLKDTRDIEHWAALRLSLLKNVSTSTLREAVGAVPVLVAADRVGWPHAAQLLQAFGITNIKLQGQLVDWALRLSPGDYDCARQTALVCGIGPVLAALELTEHMNIYRHLAVEHGVECCCGLAWR